jgi:hypothetical protein
MKLVKDTDESVAGLVKKAAMKFATSPVRKTVQRPLAVVLKVVDKVVPAKKGAFIKNQAADEKLPFRLNEALNVVFDVQFRGVSAARPLGPWSRSQCVA